MELTLKYCRSYLGMTVHWIDSNTMKRNKAVLACRRLTSPHTHGDVTKLMSDIYEQFGIADKLSGITTDNGTNFLNTLQ